MRCPWRPGTPCCRRRTSTCSGTGCGPWSEMWNGRSRGVRAGIIFVCVCVRVLRASYRLHCVRVRLICIHAFLKYDMNVVVLVDITATLLFCSFRLITFVIFSGHRPLLPASWLVQQSPHQSWRVMFLFSCFFEDVAGWGRWGRELRAEMRLSFGGRSTFFHTYARNIDRRPFSTKRWIPRPCVDRVRPPKNWLSTPRSQPTQLSQRRHQRDDFEVLFSYFVIIYFVLFFLNALY